MALTFLLYYMENAYIKMISQSLGVLKDIQSSSQVAPLSLSLSLSLEKAKAKYRWFH